MLMERPDQNDTVPEPAARGAPQSRRLLFISHATPEDSVFAEWLATQLAIAGYEVWCDVTQLLGGEKFWRDITEAIEQHAFRFIFVSTLEGNTKPGTLRELHVAQGAQKKFDLKDFIIPVKIDQFPFASMQQSVRQLNVIGFDLNWAAGLRQLLQLLGREQAPKSQSADADCVTEWYRRSIDTARRAVISDERYLSNWFRFKLPRELRFHRFRGDAEQLARLAATFERPHRVHENLLVTFASLAEVEQSLGGGWAPDKSHKCRTDSFIRYGRKQLGIAAFDASNIVSDMIRQAWEAEMTRRGLCSFALASGLLAWFFPAGHLEKNRAYFSAPGGRRTYRQLVGLKSKKSADGTRSRDGFWHYAISASPQLLPFPRIVLRHHVIFTDDGSTPWSSAERMHKARRRVCKQWWNAEWRDRLLAFCRELGGSGSVMPLPVSSRGAIRLSTTAMSFLSPWSYLEDSSGGLDETLEIELVEELDDDEDDEDDEQAT